MIFTLRDVFSYAHSDMHKQHGLNRSCVNLLLDTKMCSALRTHNSVHVLYHNTYILLIAILLVLAIGPHQHHRTIYINETSSSRLHSQQLLHSCVVYSPAFLSTFICFSLPIKTSTGHQQGRCICCSSPGHSKQLFILQRTHSIAMFLIYLGSVQV